MLPVLAALLLALVAGCASVTPEAPKASPRDADTPQPSAAVSVAKPSPPPARATANTATIVAKPAPAPALDLNALKDQLRKTDAIGVFTKVSLKNQMDDFLQQFRDYYQGKSKTTIAQLRRSYDLLIMKVLSLLQDADQQLASAIVSSREAIWGLLADPKKFATLDS
jgi:hypothetical protein